LSEKLSKLELVEKKAQDALRKAKAELKKERDEQTKKANEERNVWLLILGKVSLQELIKNGGGQELLNNSSLDSRERNLLTDGLKKEGAVL